MKQNVLCMDNYDYPVSLTKYRIYELISEKRLEETGMFRIIDDSGEDYLHSKKRFIHIESFDYDREADVMYVNLKKPQNAVETLPQENGILLRYDKDETIVGITFMNYEKNILKRYET